MPESLPLPAAPRAAPASRDDFAVAALMGLLAGMTVADFHAQTELTLYVRISELSYRFADAMLKARGL